MKEFVKGIKTLLKKKSAHHHLILKLLLGDKFKKPKNTRRKSVNRI